MPFGFGKGKKRGRRLGWGGNRRGSETDGPPATCICPECSFNLPHKSGIPCFQTKCPQCGSPMTRRFFVEE